MEFVEFLINYWYVIVGLAAVLVVAGIAVYKYAGLPTKAQVKKIKEWLLFAVTKAEAELGSGTGALKLRTVYDMFIAKFPTTAKLVSFETFSMWVDAALVEMREMLAKNESIQTLVFNTKM